MTVRRMRKITVLLLGIILIASSNVSFLPVKAGTRTIIVPDDYSKIEAAIANANNGDTVFIREGTYKGSLNQTLVINKAIDLYGENRNTTVLSLSPPLVRMNIFTYEYMDYLAAIQIDSDKVTISGLTINAPGGGISGSGDEIKIVGITATTGFSIEGSHTTISRNMLKGDLSVVGNNNIVVNNRFETALVGPSFSCVGSNNVIANNSLATENKTRNIKLDIEGANNVITNNLFRTIHLKGDDNIVYKNSMKVLPGDSGVYLTHSSRNTICANKITYAESLTYEQEGVFLSESHDNVIYANHLESLFKGAYLQNTDTEPMIANNNTFYHNNFVKNKIQAWDYTSSTTNNFDNGKEGNYWSDYNGTDANGDGIGDTQFKPTYVYTYDHIVEKITKCNPDNFPLMAPLNIDIITIELPEWANIKDYETQLAYPIPKPRVSAEQLPNNPSGSTVPFYIVSPANTSYAAISNSYTSVPLTFVSNVSLSWVGYSLDGGANVTASNGTIIEIPVGSSSLTVYANDTVGNWAVPQTVYYSVAWNGGTPPELFPVVTVAVVSGASAIAVGVGLLVYWKKRKR